MNCLCFAVFLSKKGSLCLVCVYIVTEAENPDTQDLPKKVPSRTNSLLKVATFGPQGPPSSQTHRLRRLAGVGTHFYAYIVV